MNRDTNDSVPSFRTASILLLVLTVVVHGIFAPWKGFYMDDWRFIGLWESSSSQSLLGLMKAFNVDGYCFYRPVDIPYFSVQFWLFGRAGWAYQLLQLAFDVSAVLLLHAAWRKAGGEAALSFIAAAIFAVYPNHSSTHHWLSAPFAFVAALFSGALLFQLRAARSGTLAPAFGASMLFAVAVLTYEAVLPLAILFPFLGALSLRREGRSRGEAWRDAVISCVPLVVFSLAAALYQQVLIPRLFPLGQTRPMSLDFARVLKVLGRSFECTTTGILALASDSARRAAEAGLWLLIPSVALAGAAALWLWRRSGATSRSEGGVALEWWIGGAAAWAASYAPVAISAQGYMPHVFDEQNRLNAAGTVGASMLAAGALVRLARARPRAAAAAFAAFMAVSAGIDWVAGRDWARAWSLQVRVLSDIARQAPPGPADIALSGVPETAGRAAVFHADWEFDSALKVWTRRSDLAGTLRPAEPAKGRRAYVYRYPEGRLEPF